MEAEDVDSEIIRRDTLLVEWVDAADLAEEVTSVLGVKLVFGERFFPGK